MKAQNREFVKKSEQIFDKNERLTFIKSQLKKLEPDEEIEHMFMNENALSDRQMEMKPKTKWQHVFKAVNKWPRYQDRHQKQCVLDELRMPTQ